MGIIKAAKAVAKIATGAPKGAANPVVNKAMQEGRKAAAAARGGASNASSRFVKKPGSAATAESVRNTQSRHLIGVSDKPLSKARRLQELSGVSKGPNRAVGKANFEAAKTKQAVDTKKSRRKDAAVVAGAAGVAAGAYGVVKSRK